MKITEEQKQQLLNLNDSRVNEILGVATLKDNTWYIYNNGSLQFNIKNGGGYGITCENEWIDEVYWLRVYGNGKFREAAHKEVENALINEAKSRGFGERAEVWDLNDDCTIMSNKRGVVFYNGKWAEVIEKPNKQELINQINELLKQL